MQKLSFTVALFEKLDKKRERAVYDLSESRISKTGFRSSYAKNAEVTCAFQGEKVENEKMKKNVNRLIISASQDCKSWENKLLESCKRHDDAKLVLDLVSLLRMMLLTPTQSK